MRLSVDGKGKAFIIAVKEEITGRNNAGVFREKIYELINSNRKNVVVDLSEIKYINSIGIGLLIGGFTSIKNAGGELKLCSVSEKVRSILDFTKLNQIFSIYDNIDEAVNSFS